VTTRARSDVVIRAAAAGDLADVSALERKCYADAWPASAFATLPDNPQVCFTVAVEPAGRLVGYAIAWFVLDEGEVANLAVAPAARRRGLGRMLLGGIVDNARTRGVSRLFLEVRESNVAARALYASQSFVEIGRRKQYYRKPSEDALILRRELAGQPSKQFR
jgi:ribosomal-protein-alanine N-acetyltransferase